MGGEKEPLRGSTKRLRREQPNSESQRILSADEGIRHIWLLYNVNFIEQIFMRNFILDWKVLNTFQTHSAMSENT